MSVWDIANTAPARSSAEIIRKLNDAFRTSMSGGKVVMTSGVAALGDQQVTRLYRLVRSFDQFDDCNDPHGEHDFGAFDDDGQKFFWKIDYYDAELKFGSEDPADPKHTTRVLTLMKASEY